MILEITAAAIGGGFVGYFACAVMTVVKIADANRAWRDENDFANLNVGKKNEALLAHTRCADALTTKQSRIDRALEQVTPGANATVLRIARILRGEA